VLLTRSVTDGDLKTQLCFQFSSISTHNEPKVCIIYYVTVSKDVRTTNKYILLYSHDRDVYTLSAKT